ncbi:MAG: ABC transporter permease [Bacteroidota bacterium]
MFKNYLKIAFRNLRKRKLFTGINILGLSVAIACSLLLFLTAFRELSFDRFHQNGASIYRTYLQGQSPEGPHISTTMAVPLLPTLLSKIPDIELGTRWAGSGASVANKDRYIDVSIRFVDEDFLKMFDFPLVHGEINTALDDLGDVLLTQKQANEIFGTKNPIGESIQLNYDGLTKNFIVSGVLEDFPALSSLRGGMIVRFENVERYKSNIDNWDNSNHSVFLQINPATRAADLNQKLIAFVRDVFADDLERLAEVGWTANDNGQLLSLNLQPLYDLHFGTALAADSRHNARGYIYPIALLIMGFFILTIACINFVNLTIGSSVNRSLEVGVRKVLGASRVQLTFQFWGEAIAVIICALAIALMSLQWALPHYNSYFNSPVTMSNPFILIAIVLILVFVAIVGGAYPAFLLARFQPASVLKKQTQLQKPGKLRNFLVIIQFAISIVLISATIAIYQQLQYLHNKPLGFNQEQVISLPIGNDISGDRALSLMRQKLRNHDNVLSITGAYSNLGMGLDGSGVTSINGFTQDGKQLYSHWHGVHFDYLETLEIELLAGRTFDPLKATDSTEAIIINEAMAKQLERPYAELIGTQLHTGPNRTIIGIMQDHHFKSLDQVIEPMSLIIDPDFGIHYLFVKAKAGQMAQTMNDLKTAWQSISPKSAFEASFLDENVHRQYKSESLLSKIVLGAAFLTILLSGMGLFAIALLVIIQRTKEIGIRKVLGASVSHIVTLISKDFIKLVFIACLIAIPFSWYAVDQWLQDFHYRIQMPWWGFLSAGVIAAAIAFLTVTFHSLRAAIANPVDALKNE